MDTPHFFLELFSGFEHFFVRFFNHRPKSNHSEAPWGDEVAGAKDPVGKARFEPFCQDSLQIN
jgi:hypothetical protein